MNKTINEPKKKRTKSALWQNKDFIRIYNKLVKARLRNPSNYRNANLIHMAKDELNEFYRQQEENKGKTEQEIERKKREEYERKVSECPLQYGQENKYVPDGMTPSVKIIDNYVMIDYSDLRKKKSQSNIWKF